MEDSTRPTSITNGKDIRCIKAQTEAGLVSYRNYLIGCICWDCDDLTDEELEEYFEEAA